MCEMPSCYGHEERKAWKAHKCCECNGTIQPGETYHYQHGIWNGKAADYKVCADCNALRAECDRDARYDECTPFEGLYNSVNGMWTNAPELFVRFVEIKRRRGAMVPPWMVMQADAVNSAINGKENSDRR